MSITTTKTAVQKLRKAARQLSRSSDLSYHQALEQTAKSAGYDSWHHVAKSLADTQKNDRAPGGQR